MDYILSSFEMKKDKTSIHHFNLIVNLQYNCLAVEHPENSSLREMLLLCHVSGLIFILWVIINGSRSITRTVFWSVLPKKICNRDQIFKSVDILSLQKFFK